MAATVARGWTARSDCRRAQGTGAGWAMPGEASGTTKCVVWYREALLAAASPPPVLRRRRPQARRHVLAQFLRRQHLGVRAVAQDVHRQLARIGVGDAQLERAVAQHAPGLPRVPLLVGDPARGVAREADHRLRARGAREDAIGRAVVVVERGLVDLLRRLALLDEAHPIDREAPQRPAQVTPGVEVPVVAVVREALRGHPALGDLVAGPAVVQDAQPAPAHQCARQALERLEIGAARRHLQDADPVLDLAIAARALVQQARDALAQGSNVRLQQTGLHVGEQLERRHQGVDLRGVEPQARQFVQRVAPGVVVAVALVVVLDWRAQVGAHVVDDALDRGPRALEPALEVHARHRGTSLREDPVQGEDAVEPVHGVPFAAGGRPCESKADAADMPSAPGVQTRVPGGRTDPGVSFDARCVAPAGAG